MNEIILLLVAVLMMFIIPITISNLKTPLQSYVKITSAVLFIIFVFVIPSSDNKIWPILIISAISQTSLAREIMNIYSFKRQNKIN